MSHVFLQSALEAVETDPAIIAHRLSYQVAITRKDEKAALHRDFHNRWLDEDEIGYYRRRGHGWATVLKGIVVVDRDGSSRKAYDWLRHRRIFGSTYAVETAKGVHFYFRLEEGIEQVKASIRHLDLPVDLLTGPRLAQGVGSVVHGHRYVLRDGCSIVAKSELPLFPTEILKPREEVRQHIQTVCEVPDERARNYVDKIAISEQGKGGSRACFIAALKCLSLSGGDMRRAWELLVYFNRTRCFPPWDEEAEDGADSLKRKLREAKKVWVSKR